MKKKETTVALVTMDLKPLGINGDQFDTSTSKTPANTITITMTICILEIGALSH